MTKTKSAIQTLATTLQEKQDLLNSVKEQLAVLNKRQENCEKFLLDCNQTLPEVPQIVTELAPFVAFSITEKTVGSAINAAMRIKSELLVELENSIKGDVDKFKAQYDMLEGFCLQELEKSGVSSIKSDSGRVESRVQTRYSIADKALFIAEMQKLNAESELTITVRPNSKAMAKIVDELGELPAGISMTRSKQAVFVKT